MSADILHFTRMDNAPNRIREYRLLAKMSQQTVADMIGVSKVTISELERGRMRLDVGYMKRIAAALGVTAADLLPLDANPWHLSPDERDLVLRYRSADDDDQKKLSRVAEAIVDFKGFASAA